MVRIKRLFPGQPAMESGLLREGDIILSVNSEPLKDLSYQVSALRTIFSFVTLFLPLRVFVLIDL